MRIYCDNQVALHIASNPMRGPNKNIDYHFVREQLLSKEICTEFVGFNNQPVDILTNPWVTTDSIYRFQAWNIQSEYFNWRGVLE